MELNKLTKAVGHSDLYINESGEAYHIRKINITTRVTMDGAYKRSDEYYSGELFHRIMAKTFLDNPQNLPEVDHINHDSLDNRLDNLQWITMEANTAKQSFNPRARYKGIEYDKDRDQYRGYVQFKDNGVRKKKRTARYKTKEEAAEARLELIKTMKEHILNRFEL